MGMFWWWVEVLVDWRTSMHIWISIAWKDGLMPYHWTNRWGHGRPWWRGRAPCLLSRWPRTSPLRLRSVWEGSCLGGEPNTLEEWWPSYSRNEGLHSSSCDVPRSTCRNSKQVMVYTRTFLFWYSGNNLLKWVWDSITCEPMMGTFNLDWRERAKSSSVLPPPLVMKQNGILRMDWSVGSGILLAV